MSTIVSTTYFSKLHGRVKFVVTKDNDLFYVHCVGGVMDDGADHWTALQLSSALKMIEENIEDLILDEE